LKLHKVSVESLSFSHNEQYLTSVGGEDDKCTVIVWDVLTGKALYG
jgi:WD40 repeat protein